MDNSNFKIIYRTTDYGKNWQMLPGASNDIVRSLGERVYDEQSMSWIAYDKRRTAAFAISKDDGETWTPASYPDFAELVYNYGLSEWGDLSFTNRFAKVNQYCIGFALPYVCGAVRGIPSEISSAVENDTPPVEIPTVSSVFPQPATDEVRFNVKAYSGVRSVTIYSALGREIADISQQLPAQSELRWSVADWPAGIYTVIVEYDSGTSSSLFVVAGK